MLAISLYTQRTIISPKLVETRILRRVSFTTGGVKEKTLEAKGWKKRRN